MDKARYVIESTDPYSPYPERTDERFECASVVDLANRLDELTDISPPVAAEEALAVFDGGDFEWTDQETGREVSAWRVAAVVEAVA